ncbi:hypothetical protein G6F65_018782 [Rhizopus arrhizus]|nr:hypothetical protein G6F65_018782 [Rhizopus arrhizus]
MTMHRELTAGVCALVFGMFTAPPALADAKPLLQEGKKTLFQRVLTTPSCELTASAGEPKGKPLPPFSRYYVYERASAAGADWIKVGPDSFGKTTGWLKSACAVEWKMQLTLAFTNPANRDRTLFFKDRAQLEKVLDAPAPVSVVAPLRQQMKTAAVLSVAHPERRRGHDGRRLPHADPECRIGQQRGSGGKRSRQGG